MLYRHYMIGVLLICLWLFAACGKPREVPNIGPVYGSSGRSSTSQQYNYPELYIELMSKTNCVDFGENITFTLFIKNEKEYTITLEQKAQIDITILERYGDQQFEHHWSKSESYPHNINKSFAPGEQRLYQWQWRAEPRYRMPAPSSEYSDWQSIEVYSILDSAKASAPNYLYRSSASIDLYVGAIPLDYGDPPNINETMTCVELLQNLGRVTPTPE